MARWLLLARQIFRVGVKSNGYLSLAFMIDTISFLAQAIKGPKNIGAIAPSSEGLADLIVREAKLEDAKIIVELGPGTGVFTKAILKAMEPEADYLALEINKQFADTLKLTHPGVAVYHDSAEAIGEYLRRHGHKKCDRVISGLPWTAFDTEMQRNLIGDIHEALVPGGMFLTFAYFPLNHLPSGRAFYEELSSRFSSVEKTDVVSNLPPAFVYICVK